MNTFFPPNYHDGLELVSWHYVGNYNSASATYADSNGHNEVTINIDVC